MLVIKLFITMIQRRLKMPNWCNNSISIGHADAEKMQIVRDALAKDSLFSVLIPCPQELVDTVAGSVSEDKKQEHEEQVASNIEKYGYPDWYAFQNANWGTKWDICDINVNSDDGNIIYLDFNTAWSPATNAYEKLIEMGYTIHAVYYESGMGFCGIWNNGEDEYYTIDEPNNQQWLDDNIPAEILENMGIEAWEDEDED
jgi:hypothetical protein